MDKKAKILVVDDDEAVLDFLKEVIESEGYSFIKATRGEEALIKIKEDKPDLVLLDIEMPDLNGLEVLGLIREEDKTLPVIILTAYGTSERFKEAMRLNVSGFIPKGTSVKDAVYKIQTALKIVRK